MNSTVYFMTVNVYKYYRDGNMYLPVCLPDGLEGQAVVANF